MKKPNHAQPSLGDLTDTSWEDNRIIQWLLLNGRLIILALLIALAVCILLYRISASSESKADSDFLSADQSFATFVQAIPAGTDPSATEDALSKLETVLKSRPELHAKYDGLIAQTLINRGNTEQAIPFADLAIKRTEAENQPYYTAYSNTTLLIGKNQYKEALNQAQELQKKMLADTEHTYGEALLAFNLLRISMLQQKLGLKEEEQKSWLEWNQLASDYPKAFAPIINHFQEGKVSLANYIEARETILKSK